MAEPSGHGLRIIIAVRPPEEGKSRLSPVLAPAQRAELNRRLFAHVAGVCRAFAGPDQCIVVSRSRELLDEARELGMTAVMERGSTLPGALAQGMEVAAAQGDGPVLTIATDLPRLSPSDLAAMADAAHGVDVVIAPDWTGQGTNALLLARPGLIPCRHGPDSCAAHVAEADRAGFRHALVKLPGLARDIDTPEDLAKEPAQTIYSLARKAR